jgi:hypothetical protein
MRFRIRSLTTRLITAIACLLWLDSKMWDRAQIEGARAEELSGDVC